MVMIAWDNNDPEKMRKREAEEKAARLYILGYAMCKSQVYSKTSLLENAEGMDDLFMFADRQLEAIGIPMLTEEEKALIRPVHRRCDGMADAIVGGLRMMATDVRCTYLVLNRF